MQLRRPKLSPAFHRGFAAGAIAAAFVLACGSLSAQTIFVSTDLQGHARFSDRAETANANFTQDAADAMLREQRETSAAKERGRVSESRSRAIDRSEALRRLRQAEHEFARGPDMQQGIPPIAEKVSGDRRRERLLTLQRHVAEAQARIRELDAGGVVARQAIKTSPIVALQ